MLSVLLRIEMAKMSQLMLHSFKEKEISVEKATEDLKPYNNVILDWEIECKDFMSEDIGSDEGKIIKRHIKVVMKESLVKARNEKGKRIEVPGYKVFSVEDVYDDKDRLVDGFISLSEDFKEKDKKKATDCFMEYILTIQNWIMIAESRAKSKPDNKQQFECLNCGWCSEVPLEETEFKDTCLGCGRRYW
jgi:hypothetical protein